MGLVFTLRAGEAWRSDRVPRAFSAGCLTTCGMRCLRQALGVVAIWHEMNVLLTQMRRWRNHRVAGEVVWLAVGFILRGR